MRHLRLLNLIAAILILPGLIYAQKNLEASGVEDVLVEIYHVVEDEGIIDSNGQNLPVGTVTYRIFLDLKEGYSLQAIYGIKGHPLVFKTSTRFYNHIDWGAATGAEVLDRRIGEYGVALDSWLTIGGASRKHLGIPISDDNDGSLLDYPDLEMADGLILAQQIPSIIEYGIDLHMFDELDDSGIFSTEDGAMAVLGGIKGLNEKNLVLIAQLTTDGQLSFEINVQVSDFNCQKENYVARNPERKEIEASCLHYPDDSGK